jgi:AcrR family transcriptional regulator
MTPPFPASPADGPPADGREALKFHNRRAIIDAAAALAEERGLGSFTVTDLAERAGVARRTIFNHFASADDAVYARCSELLGVIVDSFAGISDPDVPPRAPGPGTVLEQLIEVVERPELIQVMSQIARLIGGQGNHPAAVLWTHEVSRTITARLAAVIAERSPGADPFTVTLLASSLLNSVEVTFVEWVQETEATVTPASRERWQALLRTALEHLRHGFAS